MITKKHSVPGLQNLGRTCFLNVVLQALSASSKIVQYVCALEIASNAAPGAAAVRPEIMLLAQLRPLLHSLNEASSSGVIPMANFIKLLPAAFADRTVEHDAQEFMMWLFDQIDALAKTVLVGSALFVNTKQLPFRGCMTVKFDCSKCEIHNERQENFEILGLHLPP